MNWVFRNSVHASVLCYLYASLLAILFAEIIILFIISRMGVGREVSISLDGVRDKNLMQLKKLNIALFPVRYNEKYYADALASGEFTKLGSTFSALLICFILVLVAFFTTCVLLMHLLVVSVVVVVPFGLYFYIQ